MKYSGRLYESLDCDDPEVTFRVTGAVVTPDRVSVDWEDAGELLHLQAKSLKKGVTYRGHYGWPRPQPNCRIDLKRYSAKDGSVLLLGKWWEADTGNEGYSLFELVPQ